MHYLFQLMRRCTASAALRSCVGKRLQCMWVIQQVFRQLQWGLPKLVTLPHQAGHELAQALNGMHMARPTGCVQRRPPLMRLLVQIARMIQ